MSNKNTGRNINGKGYYIALILCAAAIGISGYLYYQNANPDTPGGEAVDVAATDDGHVEAVVTDPVEVKTPEGTAPATKPQTGKTLQTGSPVEGETLAGYAMDCLSYNATTRDWRVHNGVDIAAEAGTQVLAAADGTVYTTYEDETMGHTVVIRHDGGFTTIYSSLDAVLAVSAGDEVKLGDVIGCVGNTALVENALGDHVHFSVTRDDEAMDPADFLSLGE